MALEIKIDLNSLAKSGKEIYLDDKTGDYDAVNNPTGYGAPNPERASIELYVVAQYLASEENILLEPQTYNPETVSTWTIPTDKDGRYEVNLIGLNKFDGDVNNYAVGDLVGDNGTPKKIIDDGGLTLEEIPVADLILEEYSDSIPYKDVYENLFVPRISFAHLKLQTEFDEAFLDFTRKRCSKDSLQEIERKLKYVRGQESGAINRFCKGNKASAQKVVEMATQYIADFVNDG